MLDFPVPGGWGSWFIVAQSALLLFQSFLLYRLARRLERMRQNILFGASGLGDA